MNFKKRLPALIILLVQAGVVLAQPGGGGDPGHGQPVPIPGIPLLLMAGMFIGLRNLVKRKLKDK